MSDVVMRRLIGVLVLFLGLYLVAECLPEPDPLDEVDAAALSAGEVTEGVVSPSTTRQRVIYDLRPPMSPMKPPAESPALHSTPSPIRLKPAPVLNPKAGWYVQLGSYASAQNARAALARMQAQGQTGQVQTVPAPVNPKKPEEPVRPFYRTRLGPYATIEVARQVQQLAVENGFPGAQKIEVR